MSDRFRLDGRRIVVAGAGGPASIAEAAGAVDGLVCVVGGNLADWWSPLDTYTAEQWAEVMAHNLHWVLPMAQALLPSMIERGGGSIVTISSISAIGGSPFHAAYGAAKAGLESLTRTMAMEWGHHGVRANSVRAGTIATPRAGGVVDDPAARRTIPIGRRGRPDDIASATAFLLGEGASYVSGHTLTVDGAASTKLSHIGDANELVFVTSPSIVARMRGER